MSNNKDVKAEVMDLLNQIVVLTKGFSEPQQVENYNYQYQYVTSDKLHELQQDQETEEGEEPEELHDVNGDPLKTPDDDAVYLYLVGQYAQRVVKGSADDAAHNEMKYYTSTC